MYFNHLLNLFIAFTFFLLGIIIYGRSKKFTANSVFALFMLAAAVWTLSNYLADVADSWENAMLWSRLAIIGPAFMPSLILHFSWLFPQKKKINPILLGIIYVPSIIFTILTPTDLNVSNVSQEDWGTDITAGVLYNYLFVYIAVFFTLAAIQLFIDYRKSKGRARLQLTYIFWGFLFSASLGVFTNLLLVIWGNSRYTALGPFFSLVFSLFVYIAIIKHRLMGIRFAISQLYIFTLTGAFAYLSFEVVFYLDLKLWGDVHDPKAMLIGIIYAFIFAAILLPLIDKIQYSSDVIFFKGYNPKKIIKDLSLKLSSVIELNDLFKIISQEFKRILGTEDVSVLILSENGVKNGIKNKIELSKKNSYLKNQRVCISKECSLGYKKMDNNSAIFKKIKKEQRIIVKEEFNERNKAVVKEMNTFKTQVVAPLVFNKNLLGVIMLGGKIDQGAYTKEDLEFLEIMSSQIAGAIENALLYEKVESFNRTLKKRVNDQTKKLRKNNKRLKKLLEMKGDFLNIASHQLRTPVSVLIGMSQMLMEGSVKGKDKERFLKGINEKSKKLAQIIHDILSASEMDHEDFTLDLVPVDVVKLLEILVQTKKKTARANHIDLRLIVEDQIPNVLANKHYLEQAVINLINNSFQYTPKGSILVRLGMKKDKVLVRVQDTGIGIPKKNLKSLFKKFSRAQNATQAYTDGSGLGLFIVKKIISAHKDAQVYVEETALNKGTTITIELPSCP